MKKFKKHLPLSRTLPDVRTTLGFYDPKQRWLIGWPGYRIREGKSGLAYMDTHAEWAHLQGVMFYRLVTGRFQTRNPAYWICLFLYGLVSASPLMLIFIGKWTLFFDQWILFITSDVKLAMG